MTALIHDEVVPDSNLLNYAEYYEEWDDQDWEECRTCYGTGLDADEIYDCADCGGEGGYPAEKSFVAGVDSGWNVG